VGALLAVFAPNCLALHSHTVSHGGHWRDNRMGVGGGVAETRCAKVFDGQRFSVATSFIALEQQELQPRSDRQCLTEEEQRGGWGGDSLALLPRLRAAARRPGVRSCKVSGGGGGGGGCAWLPTVPRGGWMCLELCFGCNSLLMLCAA
jgi:hypothetical protein